MWKLDYKSKCFCYLVESRMIIHVNAYDVDLMNHRCSMFLFDKSICVGFGFFCFCFLFNFFFWGGGELFHNAGLIVIELRFQMIIQHILFPLLCQRVNRLKYIYISFNVSITSCRI